MAQIILYIYVSLNISLLFGINWKVNNSVYPLIFLFTERRLVSWHRSVLSSWKLASIWSHVTIRGCICSGYDTFISEAGAYILHKSTSGTASSFTGQNDSRHHKVLLHLHIGAVRLRLRSQPVTVVLCRFGETKVLPFASGCSGLRRIRETLYRLETFCEVWYRILF